MNSFAKYLLLVDDSGTWKSSLDIVDLPVYLKINTMVFRYRAGSEIRIQE